MLVYLLLGMAILIVCQIFERKYNVKKVYLNFKTYILENNQSWKILSAEIIQTHSTQSIEAILGTEVEVFLIEKKESELKVYALNNEKVKKMSEFQYNGIIKKFAKQEMFYTFNIDTGSIYYRFDSPYKTHILWMYIR